MKPEYNLHDMISASPLRIFTSFTLLFLFSLQLQAGSPNLDKDKLLDAFSAKEINTLNSADIEVYYEFDEVQLTESTGNTPLIATVSYTLFVTNNGPDEATNLSVAINYHDEVISYDRVFSTGYWAGYFWSIPSIASGETVQFTESSNIFIPYGDKWVQASLLEMDQDDTDSTPGNWDFTEDDSDMLEMNGLECDLSLTLAAENTEYEIYDYINYEVTVQNQGPSIATDVTVSIPLPSGTVISSQTSSTQGSYSTYDEIWDIGILQIGQTVILNLVLYTLDDDTPKTLFAQVQTADQPDPDSTPGNDTDQTPDEDDEAIVTVYPEGYVNCSGDIYLSSQAEVDAFGPCTVWDGNILINGDDITDFAAFDGLQEITGSIDITNDYISQINGFHQLETVGGSINFYEVLSLTSINAFTNLTDIGSNLIFHDNPNLSSIQGFENLQSANTLVLSQNGMITNLDNFINLNTVEKLAIEHNSSLDNIDGLANVPSSLYEVSLVENTNLQNLNGLSHITNIDNDLLIAENDNLLNVDPLNNLTFIGEDLIVANNDLLENLDGFNNLLTVVGNLDVINNPILSGCCGIYPLLNLNGVSGQIDISSNPYACNSVDEILTTCGPDSCSGDITLSSQAEVDAFGPCTVWDGDITIEGDDITNLESFAGLIEITGSIDIKNCMLLPNLDGLEDLTNTGSDIIILGNPMLEHMDAMNQVSFIGNRFIVMSNDQLENVDGFSALGIVEGLMYINDNESLQNLDGLLGINYVGGDLEFMDNDQLTSINILSSLTEINGSLYILGNDQLTNFDGFSNVESVASELVISANPSLVNLEALGNLQTVSNYFVINDNDLLTNLDPLSNVSTLDDDLVVTNNDNLSNCCGLFPVLSSNGILGTITIEDNPFFCSSVDEILDNCDNCSGNIVLTSQTEVDAFGPCTIFDGSITINGTDITNFSAFDGLEEITGSLDINTTSINIPINGFNELLTIGSTLDISSPTASQINGFNSLTTIGHTFNLFDNENLTSINGFNSLEVITTDLFMAYNPLLADLQGFSNIESINQFYVWSNDQLTNLDVFSNLSNLVFLEIIGNEALVDIDGLSNVSSSIVYIELSDIPNLQSLEGLSGISTVTSLFWIYDCHSLENLDGLSNMTSISKLDIHDNNMLQNLDGLSNLQTAGKINVEDNELLSDCCGLYPILSNNGVSGTITIANNPSGCSSEDEILITCAPTVCIGNLTLNTQAEVDAFDCTEVTGNLYIGNSTATDINDLSPLSSLTSVGGFLVIENNPNLNSLQGLNSLSTVGSWFFIENNDGLTDIDDLSSLQTVNGSISIRYNDLLENLDGLSALTTVDFDFFIEENGILQDVSGLSSLVTVGKTLAILNNNSLSEINGISSLVSTGEGLWMSHNENLTNITGFSSYNSIGGDLAIRLNPSLISFEVSPILHTLGASLRIEHNGSLLNLDGISGITTIVNNLWIYDNASLSDCCGIYSLLDNNGVSGSTNIYNNPNFCSSPADILDNCAPANYCDSYADFPWHEWISRVQLNSIDNASFKSSYSDFTSINTTLVKGDIYPVDLEVSFSYDTYDEYLRVWIDYNQNGSFTDPGEMAFDEILSQPPNGSDPVSVIGNVTIPMNAMTGNTRMRVALQRGSAPTPCDVIPFGEVEDYTVNLSGSSQPELTLECPDDLSVSVPAGSGGTNVIWNEPMHSTTCLSGSSSIIQTGGQPNGSFFPVGAYQIVYMAADPCGNQKTCFFTLYVEEVSDYCDSQSEAPWHDWMSGLTFAGIDNTSGKSKYSDFTAMSADVENGNSYPLSLEASYSYTTYDEYWKVWIDYNHNNAFDEPSEVAFMGVLSKPPNGIDSKTLDGLVDIPSDAMSGPTRMRVAMKRGSYAMPCETFPFGEVEDYTVNIGSTIISPIVGGNEMLMLDARLEDAVIDMKWLTNTSYKNDYYVVERSTDGIQFEALMEVENNKQAASHIYYQEQDLHPVYGKNYYRVKQFEEDGSIRYSNVQSVNYTIDLDQFDLFPNPTSDRIFVNLAKLTGLRGTIQVHNAFGQKILELRLDYIPNYPIGVMLDNFENGFYFMSAKVDGRKLASRKFIVNTTK